MNSRERIQAVLNHQMPDMLPIDFGAHRSSGMGAGSYNRLKRHLGYSEETTKLYDLMQHLAYPEPMMVERFGGDVVQIMQLQPAFGFENFYYNIAAEPELVHYWAEKLTDGYCVILDKVLNRIGKYLDIAMFGGDDLGTQISTQISPEMYREMIKPYHTKIYRFVRKKNPDVKVGLHSCGAIKSFIPDLIEAGVQVLNPIQISAEGMDPAELKERFGKDLVFWGGGADMQGFVNSTENPEEVYRHVRKLLDIFAPGGNYIFAPVHNILDNVAPEKVIAIYQAALDYRKEKLDEHG